MRQTAQWVKMPASKLGDLKLIRGIHMMEWRGRGEGKRERERADSQKLSTDVHVCSLSVSDSLPPSRIKKKNLF